MANVPFGVDEARAFPPPNITEQTTAESQSPSLWQIICFMGETLTTWRKDPRLAQSFDKRDG